MSSYITILFSFLFYFTVSANLEGPFLFWGPKCLDNFRRPALSSVDQDDLMRIYSTQSAIVVFNNQDPVPLSSGYFPRLRKMLEGKTSLVLPQDFLDVHPDYVSNDTLVSICLLCVFTHIFSSFHVLNCYYGLRLTKIAQ